MAREWRLYDFTADAKHAEDREVLTKLEPAVASSTDSEEGLEHEMAEHSRRGFSPARNCGLQSYKITWLVFNGL